MKTFNFNTKLATAALAVLMAVMPTLASASGGGGFIESFCILLVCFLGDAMVLGIATIAIIFLGIGAFFGKVNWGLALTVGIGIILIAGATEIALIFFDGAVVDCDDPSFNVTC